MAEKPRIKDMQRSLNTIQWQEHITQNHEDTSSQPLVEDVEKWDLSYVAEENGCSSKW